MKSGADGFADSSVFAVTGLNMNDFLGDGSSLLSPPAAAVASFPLISFAIGNIDFGLSFAVDSN